MIASGHLPLVVSQIADDQLLPFAIQVLYNLTVDYEPAQLAASDTGLGARLIDLVSGPRLAHCQDLLGMIGNLLELLVSQSRSLPLPSSRISSPKSNLLPFFSDSCSRIRIGSSPGSYGCRSPRSCSRLGRRDRPGRVRSAYFGRLVLPVFGETPNRASKWRQHAPPARML